MDPCHISVDRLSLYVTGCCQQRLLLTILHIQRWKGFNFFFLSQERPGFLVPTPIIFVCVILIQISILALTSLTMQTATKRRSRIYIYQIRLRIKFELTYGVLYVLNRSRRCFTVKQRRTGRSICTCLFGSVSSGASLIICVCCKPTQWRVPQRLTGLLTGSGRSCFILKN